MENIVVIKKGEYQSSAQKESAFIGVIASVNHVEISELVVNKDKTLLIMPGTTSSVTEFAYVLEGRLEESSGHIIMNQGDSVYIKDLNEVVYLKAIEDTRLIYLSHESVIQALTDAMRNLHEMVTQLDKKDQYTKSHCGRVVEWAPLIAKKMELSEQQINILIDAALFHDLGKLEISNTILHKPASLSKEEFDRIKKHPTLGKLIAEEHHLYEVGEVIEQHHERIDGTGYPHGLMGSEIRVEAKIIAVIDSFDAMTSDRPYRKGLSLEEAIAELKLYSGTYYEPIIVSAFLEVLSENKAYR